MQPEYHLFILWENARSQEDKILKDIYQHFSVVKLYEIKWTRELIANNFTRFYGTSLPHNSEKEKHCGTGPFLLIIVKDENPVYEIRLTSHGNENVNVNLFDAKTRYRLWTGGGHKVHATNNPIEFNHDLVLLLGINKNDFTKVSLDNNANIETIEKDLEGAHGWDSLERVFYVLNNTINYVILRGKEDIMSGSFSHEHRDIDILIEDFQNAKYIINGVSSCSIARPHEMIVINGYEYYLDLWVISRNYFDFRWARKMLSNRILENGYYVLTKEDELYSLLYHTLIIKGKIAEDYRNKMERLKVNLVSNTESNSLILTNFLRKNCYDITTPSDSSVKIHLEDSLIHDYAFRHGKLISINCQDQKANVPYFSVVYEKEKSYYKRGSDFLIKNEARFLKALEKYNCFPKIRSIGVGEDGSYMETNKIEGDDFFNFFHQKDHLNFDLIKSFIEECLKILCILSENKIIHRDFIGKNIIIKEENKKCNVYLIDFGWAIHKNEFDNRLKPTGLGERYSPKEGASDYYTLAMTINEMWPTIRFVKRICELLKTNVYCGEDDTEECKQIVEEVEQCLKKKIGILDRYRMFFMRYQRIFLLRRTLSSKIRGYAKAKLRLLN